MAQGAFLSLVWFLKPGEQMSAEDIFENLTGTEPDTVQRSKNANPVTALIAAASSDIEGMYVTAEEKLGRLELHFRPSREIAPSDFPKIDLDVAIEKALVGLKNAERLPVAQRISSVGRVMKPCGSEAEANTLFAELTGYALFAEDLTDLQMQMNRRKSFGDQLGNWLVNTSVYTHQTMIFSDGFSAGMSQARKEHGVSMDLDFNTVPDGSTYDADRQRVIYEHILSAQMAALNSRPIDFLT